MKLFTLIIAFVISSSLVNAQGWMWVKHFNGTGQNMPTSVIQDASGNSYVFGNINGAVTQDGISLTTNGQDAFFAKYNADGQIQWIKQLGGTYTQTAGSIVFSNDKNYIYLSLLNNGTFSFEGTDIPTIGGFDIIIVQFDIAGNYQWAFNAAYGASNQTNGALAIDNSENIILAGGFLNDVTFLGGFSLTSPSASNQKFIAKFDSWGNLYWANKIDDDNTNTTIKSISTDANGYYFSGQFAGNFYLPTGTLTSNSTYREGFIYKTDMDGNGIWARKISAINNDLYINKHITDNSGNHYLAGYYNGVRLKIDSTSTDTSKITYLNTTSGTSDLIVLKYNADGNLQWTKAIGSIKNEKAINLDISNNKLIITGSYEGSVNFGIYNLTNSGGSDAFIAESDLDGAFSNAIKASGTSNDIGQTSVYSSTGRNFIAIGDFVSPILTIGTNQLTNSLTGIRDAYVAKFGCFDSLHLSSTLICVDSEGLPIANDGTATATPSNGSEPYTYLWSNNETTPTITGLAAGTYTVTVNGANSCTAISSVNVSLSTGLALTMNQNNITCSGGNDGYASISVSGGNAPYTYIWSNSETTSDIYNLLPGSYSVTVTDQCGITAVDNALISQPDPLNVTISFTNLSCYGHGDDGTATAIATFGNEPYTYLWSNDSTNASVTGLVAGTYFVSVTDKCGETVVKEVTITTPPALITDITNRVNVTCFGLCNGSATANVTSGTSPFSYTWSTTPAQTDVNAINLCVGNYSVSVTDAAGCTSVSNFSISEPAILSGTMGQTNASCYGSCNGSAWITPSGGTAPISYLWNDAQTNDTIYSLCAGKYKVTITDINNCVYNDSVDVIQPFTLAANISQTNVSCYGSCNGTATSAPTGGDANYNYLWSTIPANTTNSISSLCEGKYYLTVSDAYGCSVIDSVTITQPEVLTSITSFTPISCFGGNDGTASATPTGGTPSYSYLWSDNQTTATATNLIAGVFSVTVTDLNNCTTTNFVTITEPTVLSVLTSFTQISCFGGNDGTATATPAGGTPPYTYLWSDNQTTATATNLVAGVFSVTITDLNNCTATNSVTITEPSALTVLTSFTQISCFGRNDGTATATPAGGTPSYSYLWSDNQTTATAINLVAGNYSVTITDGCSNTTTSYITVTEPSIMLATPSQIEPSINSCDGTATISTTGGTSPYTYYWNTSPVQTTSTATNICGGICSVTITDNNSCTTTQEYAFKKAINLSVFGTPTANTATLIWDGSNATNYQLQFYIEGTTEYNIQTITSSPYTLNSLQPNTAYCCRIRTNIDGNYSNYSPIVHFTTASGSSILATNLAIQGTPTATTANLTWSGSGADSYQIQYYIDGTTNYLFQSSTNSPYTLTNLIPNTIYNCRIRTYSGGTYSNYSSAISFTTADGSYIATNLNVSGTPTANSATLIWDGSGADYYQIQYYIDGTTNYLSQNSTSSPLIINALQPNTTYNCRIRTYFGGTYTSYSSIVSFTTADGSSILATNLAVSGTPSANAATLIWNGSGADSYQIQYYINGTTNYLTQTATNSPTTLNSLQPNTSYNCRIRTFSGGVYSNYSSVVSFTTANGTSILATNLSVVGSPTTTTCTLSWDGSGATSYQIIYYKAGTTIYKFKSSTSSPATLTALEANTTYNCRIRTYSGGTYSNYSPILSFTTASTAKSYTELTESTMTLFDINTYPNPATDVINLDFNSEKEGLINLSIYNINGMLCETTIIENSVGQNHFLFKINNLSSGIYFMILSKNDFSYKTKLIVQ
ncbi:MAG: fibronectin type III domain-containing protein [Bacteroidia bacterium]|nr:fibronectin type III domain-containing protein [Bacteroidia bacterium]